MRQVLLVTVIAALAGSPGWTGPAVTVSGADAADRAALQEALDLFGAHGLRLPDLEVRFYEETTPCGGLAGRFQTQHTPWRILICSSKPFVLPHELAHAWDAETLDQDDRARYLVARGLAAWNDPAVAWRERGVEDAAFVVQQNLTVAHVPANSPEWQERIRAYSVLTGQSSPLCSTAAEYC